MPRAFGRGMAVTALALIVAGCGGRDVATTAPRVTPITVAQARSQTVDVTERTVGRLEAVGAPAIAAEVAGRIVRLRADIGTVVKAGDVVAEIDPEVASLAVASVRANVERLETLLANQERTVQRYLELKSQAVSQSMLEDATAQRDSFNAELRDARAKLADAEYRLARTRVRSPVDAIIEQRKISVGDYVAVGQPLFTVVNATQIRAVLPFPERMAFTLKPGLKLRITSPVRRDERIEARVSEIRPVIGSGSRALEALANLPKRTDWPPGASVEAELVIESRPGIVVPAASLVQRPAGEVVYAVESGIARQRVVSVGVRTPEWAEILSGLESDTPIAVDGAGFLTDGAPVRPVPAT